MISTRDTRASLLVSRRGPAVHAEPICGPGVWTFEEGYTNRLNTLSSALDKAAGWCMDCHNIAWVTGRASSPTRKTQDRRVRPEKQGYFFCQLEIRYAQLCTQDGTQRLE